MYGQLTHTLCVYPLPTGRVCGMVIAIEHEEGALREGGFIRDVDIVDVIESRVACWVENGASLARSKGDNPVHQRERIYNKAL